MRLSAILVFFTCLAAAGQVSAATGEGDITGYWQTPSRVRSAVVYIVQENGLYSGKIVALQQPRFPDNAHNGHAGEKKTDIYNPDKRLRDRPLTGLMVVWKLHRDGERHWSGGAYNPDTGKSYRLEANLDNSGQWLKMLAYIGISLLGETQEWKRVPDAGIFHNGSAIHP